MNRIKQIDILRAVAVILVLGRHLDPCPEETSHFWHQVTGIWHGGGWIGVDLFFVLSGFLVSGLLFREHERRGKVDLWRFLMRRGFKIYPPFWVLVGITVILWVPRHHEVPWALFFSELFFVQNYLVSLWTHTWSLAVEEHFYLLLTLLVAALAGRRSPRPFSLIPAVVAVVAVLSLVLRLVTASRPNFFSIPYLFYSHLRLDSLFFGVLLSYLYHQHPVTFMSFARRFRFLLLGAGLLLLLPAFTVQLERSPFIFSYGLTLLYVGNGCLLAAALGCHSPTGWPGGALCYLGVHSYSVYLWHVPLLLWGTAAANALFPHCNWFVHAGVYLVGSLVIGIGMAIVIEFPVLRIRDRFLPPQGSPTEVGPEELEAPVHSISVEG